MQKVIVLGDFNGHLGYLGNQKLDTNGKRVLDFIEKNSMILLNADDKCQGTVTREESGHKSSIDFVLVNTEFYRDFVGMKIDEEKNITDLSDHCLLGAEFELSCQKQSSRKKIDTSNYYSVKDDLQVPFIKRMETKIREGK